MPDESRILELLEEALDSRRTPEDVCADAPELLWEVRERWERCQNVEAQIEAMFPTTGSGKKLKKCLHLPTTLPVIPGYQIETVLGRGGMGVVYKAKHLKLNRSVAIKMLLCGELAGTEEWNNLIKEAQAVAGLTHGNIVQVHDVGDLDGLPYFTMEFMEGGSLAQKLHGVPQPAREAASTMVLLARAVHAAHQGGVVHRDLKPSNVLLTSDGTLKITDFGLARRVESGPAVSMKAARVGTPSYMAPEQAMGKVGAFCPSVDLYSLGAILYEMLTGRPPFKGETASETQRQLISEEPVAPQRLNAKVPCDLQTICLKCLRKDPQRRYESAAELADDLERFLKGEPVMARPTSIFERAFKWGRRHPESAVLIAASIVLVIILALGLQRFFVNRSERRHAVETDLKELVDLQNRAQWSDAQVVLARTKARLEDMTAGDLRQRVDQAGTDLSLVIKLDAIRLSRFTNGQLPYYKSQADQKYAAVFPSMGLMTPMDDVASAAMRIRASNIRSALVAALDDWSVCAISDERRRWVLQVVNMADPDPTGWRARIRDWQYWSDKTALGELAEQVPVADQPVALLLALSERIDAAGGDAPAFLKRVQKEYPADFWANLMLGDALVRKSPIEAGGYYRAVLASRPRAAVGYTSLGDAFNQQLLRDEAVAYYRKAVDIDDNYARGWTNLGNVLKNNGKVDEAIACYQKALSVDPNYGWAHYDLGNTLEVAGRLEEAMEHFRRFHDIDPSNNYITNLLRADLVRQGRGEEALLDWQRQLAAEPSDHDAYFGYAEMCLFLEHPEQYQRARKTLLHRFGTSTDPNVTEKVARACLLMSGTEEETQMAAALAQRAIDAKDATPQWVYRYFQFAQGLAEYRLGHFDQAISIMKSGGGGVMGPSPRLIIAMCQYQKGEASEARKSLAGAIVRFDWSPRHADRRDHLIMHIFRREAEAMILPNLPAFLNGAYRPQDNIERLAMLGACRSRNLNATAAALYVDAFAADPKLVDERSISHRYAAACAAALAGCGVGDDAARLNPGDRVRWRRQARQWLQEELDSNSANANKKMLGEWQRNPDLAGIRDANRLDNLPMVERQECTALWNRVAAALVPAQATR